MLLGALPIGSSQAVHSSPRCCGYWLLMTQAFVLLWGIALGPQEPPHLAVVPEIMVVSYLPHPGEGGGQRLSDEMM